jgi:hypothetical protein
VYNFFISQINAGSDFEPTCANELTLHAADVEWEVFHEMSHSFSFFAGQLGPFNTIYLLDLKDRLNQKVD